MRIISFLFKAVVVIALLVGALFGLARFHDGPISMIPGGPLESGEWVDGLVPDWSFARSIPTIELQLEGDDTSRTVWILVRGDDAYIPCSRGFPPGKEWHLRADDRGEALPRPPEAPRRGTLRPRARADRVAQIRRRPARRLRDLVLQRPLAGPLTPPPPGRPARRERVP